MSSALSVETKSRGFTATTTFPDKSYRNCQRLFTFGHRAGADVRRHAAAARVGRVVAGVDLDLVAGEVAQVGDDGGLLGEHGDHSLAALKSLLVLVLGAVRALGQAGRGGGERVCSVGDAHD